MVESGRVPHAILLHQEDGGEAFPMLLNFLEELYAGSPKVAKLIHPDIHFVFPVAGEKNPTSERFIGPFREYLLSNPCFFESGLYTALGIEGKQGNISVAEARSILEKLSLSAVEGGYRTVVIYLPEKMNGAAANALLKMLEEPPQNTLFVLVSNAPEKVLVTIRSRCLNLRIMPVSSEEKALRHSEEALEENSFLDLFHELLEAVSARDLLTCMEVAESIADLKGREKQKAFCKAASEDLRRLFLVRQGLVQIAGIPSHMMDFYNATAAKLPPSFPRLALSSLSRSLNLLERNVNQKILFTDLALKLYSANQQYRKA